MDNILNYFIKEPEKEYYVRELAKLMKKSPTTVSKYLNNFKKEGLLKSEKKFNHLLFKANIENKKFKDLKLFYNIEKIRESGLIDYLNDKFNYPTIVLFGSFSKAENGINSDIDILIITSLKNKVNLEKYEGILGHKIQLFLHSSSELSKMKNKNLLNNFINGFVLDGYWEIFK